MPLNDDPNAMTDEEYWAKWEKAVEKQGGTPGCSDAPPAELVAQIAADLDGDGEPG